MYIRKLFKFIRRLFGSAVVGTEVLNTVATVQEQEPPLIEDKKEVKEVAWFTRANNLVAEFAFEPTPVYSSNFESSKPIGYLDADGKIMYEDEYQEAMAKLMAEREELLADDVSLLEGKYIPKTDEKIANYKTGL